MWNVMTISRENEHILDLSLSSTKKNQICHPREKNRGSRKKEKTEHKKKITNG